MRNPTKNSEIALIALSSVILGATLSLIVFPKNRKNIIRYFYVRSNKIKDIVKVKLHNAIENINNEIECTSEKLINYMQLEKVYNTKIIDIILKIQNDYPELSKYIDEMPVTIPNSNNPEINFKNQKQYYCSLELLLNIYKQSHVK
jgi:hypothetical protein